MIPARGMCAECGKTRTVKKDGTMRWHGDAAYPPGMCKGVDHPPAPAVPPRPEGTP